MFICILVLETVDVQGQCQLSIYKLEYWKGNKSKSQVLFHICNYFWLLYLAKLQGNWGFCHWFNYRFDICHNFLNNKVHRRDCQHALWEHLDRSWMPRQRMQGGKALGDLSLAKQSPGSTVLIGGEETWVAGEPQASWNLVSRILGWFCHHGSGSDGLSYWFWCHGSRSDVIRGSAFSG